MEKGNNLESDSDAKKRPTPTEFIENNAGVPSSIEEWNTEGQEKKSEMGDKKNNNKFEIDCDTAERPIPEGCESPIRIKDIENKGKLPDFSSKNLFNFDPKILQSHLHESMISKKVAGQQQHSTGLNQEGVPFTINNSLESDINNLHGIPGIPPPCEKPPPYDQIFSGGQGDIEHLAEKDQISHAVIQRELTSLRSDVFEGLGSVEERLVSVKEGLQRNGGTIIEIKHQVHQANQIQQDMNERLKRIEQHLQAKQPQIELNEDRVTQRVVEIPICNELAAKTQFLDDSMECTKTQFYGTKVPIWKATCPKLCLCACHFQNKYNNLENDRDDARSTKGRRKASVEKSHKKEVNLPNSEDDDKQVLLGACGGDPGGSPSDDSSSDDDDDRDHKDRNYSHERKDKSRQNISWKIDTDEWIACLKEDGDFKQKANSLLKQGKLPNQIGLQAVCSRCTISSSILKKICKNICLYIKNKSERIEHVWAATAYSKDISSCSDDIIFVVLTTDTEQIKEENFLTYQRYILQVDETRRNNEINRKECDNPLTPGEKEKLEKCLREKGKFLMDKHSNLTRVTATWFRAEYDNTEMPSLKRELCIALYVQIKGYVPIGEEPFPSEIEGFPVVVREGIFTLCKGANEHHQNVKMGCAIAGEQIGTLGAFIEFEDDPNLYGLTCAHVVFGNSKMETIIKTGQSYFRDNIDATVYQPATKDLKPLGKLDTIIYKSGGNGLTGMEIALININQNRWPTDGTFPDDTNYAAAGFGERKPFLFRSGRVLNTATSSLPSHVVYKYGSTTKLTRGVFRVNEASVRKSTFIGNVLHSLVLHGQMEIQQLKSMPFADSGDSGALVFIDDTKLGLSALGLCEGTMIDTYMVTPIHDVLSELCRHKNKQCRLKMFQSLDQNINDSRVNVDHETVSSLSAKLDGIEQGFAQDLAQHKIEIKQELRKQYDAHEKSSQEIKDGQEIQREESKKQNQEIKDQYAQILAILKPPTL